MEGKLALAAGFIAGYVLGSRAGRQRYEEIVATARKLGSSQTVQSTAGVLQAQANDLVSKAKHTIRRERQPDVEVVEVDVDETANAGSDLGSRGNVNSNMP